MLLGQVAGKVWATKKSPALTGQALLTVAVDDGTVLMVMCEGQDAVFDSIRDTIEQGQ